MVNRETMFVTVPPPLVVFRGPSKRPTIVFVRFIIVIRQLCPLLISFNRYPVFFEIIPPLIKKFPVAFYQLSIVQPSFSFFSYRSFVCFTMKLFRGPLFVALVGLLLPLIAFDGGRFDEAEKVSNGQIS